MALNAYCQLCAGYSLLWPWSPLCTAIDRRKRSYKAVGPEVGPRPAGNRPVEGTRGTHRTLTSDSADNPGFSMPSVLKSWPSGRSKSMRIGTRWAVFTWLPVEVFGGRTLNTEPAPPPRFVTCPLQVRP